MISAQSIQFATNLTSITFYLLIIAIALLIIAAKMPNRKTRSSKKK